MKNKIQWIDFRALVRDDSGDPDFGVGSFIFFGNRHLKNLEWWWFLIPGVNMMPGIAYIAMLLTAPIRLLIINSQMGKLKRNAYDIEYTTRYLRLIRNKNGDLGLCAWGDSYEYCRKVLLESQYAKIERWQEQGFVVTDKTGKMGLFDAYTEKWILPCEYEELSIESEQVIKATIKGHSQCYNIKGDRIIV